MDEDYSKRYYEVSKEYALFKVKHQRDMALWIMISAWSFVLGGVLVWFLR